MNKEHLSRRNLLKFIGGSSVTLSTLSPISLMTGCETIKNKKKNSHLPSFKDDVVLADELSYDLLISWGDPINQSEVFGFNNDHINLIPLNDKEVIMWVNHEYHHPLFVGGWERTKENIDMERALVGGSILKLKKAANNWQVVLNDPMNKGVRGDTKIPFHNDIKIKGSKNAIGTIANCSGGKTPWNTFLTCEENYHLFYGDYHYQTKSFTPPKNGGWNSIYPHPPEHYGWVVEVNPFNDETKKLISLGRFAHESATCHKTKDGRVVVYSGDDKEDEFIYKFISKTNDSLDEGVLYCADTINGRWLPLDLELSPELKKVFDSQLDVVTYARESAKILGATPQNRPEDIEIHPKTGEIFVALTNNKKKGDFHGSILKIQENNNDPGSLTFESETFLLGGLESNISCPDNMAFDQNANLWITTDISGKALGTAKYKKFGNNGLFVIPSSGEHQGEVIQVASAPIDAEFTGPCFSPDQKELFLSVQHPGEMTKDLKSPTSTWPNREIPKPSVIVIKGKYLESFTQR